MTKKFWNFAKNEADPSVGELNIYSEISDVSWWGDEVTPAQFKKDLDSLGDISTLNININSPGGDVFAGQTIYSILKRHSAHKVVHIDGLAASIASIVAMAGDEIIMPKNAMMMIHNAWTYAAGNKNELREMADTLEKIDGVLCSIYVEKTGRKAEEVQAKMDAESWFTADEALEFGLIDSVGEEMKVAALDKKFFNKYHNVPDDVVCVEVANITIPAEAYTTTKNITIGTGTYDVAPYNGEATQPVEEDKPTPPAEENALDSQRQEFNRIKKKLLGKD